MAEMGLNPGLNNRLLDWKFMCVLLKMALRRRAVNLYSKSSLTLKVWRFNLSFPCVSVLFLNSWRVSVVPYYATTHPPAIQKQH
jgi:hypothetical protein